MLSKPNTWFTALKHDQAAYMRKPDSSYEVILSFHHAVKFHTPNASSSLNKHGENCPLVASVQSHPKL